MDITSITTAYEGLKVGKSLLKSVYDSKVEADAKEKIDNVMSRLGEAQDTLFSMREELFSLQTENEKLRRAASEAEAWENKLSQYELHKTEGGAIVYKFNGEPQHYACPSCIENKSLHILQDKRVMAGIFKCVSCEANYPIKPAQSVSVSIPRTTGMF